MTMLMVLLRASRAVLGLYALVNMFEAFGMAGSRTGAQHVDQVGGNFIFGVMLFVLFIVMRWIINVVNVRKTGVPCLKKFWAI